ncbi:MAG: lasso RiPP family leader peptide-containing protein [Colwellia sp.]|nr:lasso RiPP family leader peptide-containing protein [Colwellia sp.]
MNSINTQNNTQVLTHNAKAAYTKPVLKNAGSLAELTQGFSGSIPDEQGGHTKRNPFQG